MSDLVQRMRERTAALHIEVEQSAIVASLISGQVSRPLYALYLRNLLPAYQTMEQALRRSQFRGLAQPSIYRADSIRSDLAHLAGEHWATALPLLPAGTRYAKRIEGASTSARLIGHCYARYLGDLLGGQIIGRRLARIFGADRAPLAFTAFPAIPDPRCFAEAYRMKLNQAGDALADLAPVIEEAAVAFQLNIEVSREVGRFIERSSTVAA